VVNHLFIVLNRAYFFKKLLALPFGYSLFSIIQKIKPGEVYTINRFCIAGYAYYEGDTILNELRENMVLSMVPEPKNIHDQHAIEVYYGDTKLGYIPQSENLIIGKLLDQEAPVSCAIAKIRHTGSDWEKVKVEIRLNL